MEALIVLLGALTVAYASMLLWMSVPEKEVADDAKRRME